MSWLVYILLILGYAVGFYSSYRAGRNVGYKEGAEFVLDQWRESVIEEN